MSHRVNPPRNPFTTTRPAKAQSRPPAVFRCPCCGRLTVHV